MLPTKTHDKGIQCMPSPLKRSAHMKITLAVLLCQRSYLIPFTCTYIIEKPKFPVVFPPESANLQYKFCRKMLQSHIEDL